MKLKLIKSIHGRQREEMIDDKFKTIQIKDHCEKNQSTQNQIRKDIGKEAGIRENRWERKNEWNTISSNLKEKCDRIFPYDNAIASERDTEKYWEIISLLIAIQIKQSDYMRQYEWNSESSP